MTKRKRSSKETAAPRTRSQRQSQAKAQRKAKSRAPTEPLPVKTDDPARDKAEMEGSVLQPLPHAD
jgi:hypothetical protein